MFWLLEEWALCRKLLSKPLHLEGRLTTKKEQLENIKEQLQLHEWHNQTADFVVQIEVMMFPYLMCSLLKMDN